jgi:2-polyprenyl-3-methyl-5-hydroxy-6-metoxy-1,4-benzoquinol methylase
MTPTPSPLSRDPVAPSVGPRLQQVPNCLSCGRAGETLYRGLRDTQTAMEGSWDVSRCRPCGMTWVNPRPASEAFAQIYDARDYYTHDTASDDWDRKLVSGRLDSLSFSERLQLDLFANFVGRDRLGVPRQSNALLVAALWAFPHVRDVIASRVGWLRPEPGKRLLDVGCGGGDFLALQRHLGWDVAGLDPDGEACKAARAKHGLTVHHGDLETLDLGRAEYDVVTSFHAIEHMERPFEFLERALRLVKPGGRLLVVTPNGTGVGHRVFGASFADLLPPRHLYLFSGKVLAQRAEAAGARVLSCRSTARRGHTVWVDSWSIRKTGHLRARTSHLQKLLGVPFQVAEEVARWFDPMAGDEIVLLLEKR